MRMLKPLLVLPFTLLLAHCSDVQPAPECGAGQVLNDEGRCVDVRCEGGEVMGTTCVCSGEQILDDGRCVDPVCMGVPCDDENECTADRCNEQGVCVFENEPDDTECDAGDGVCIGGTCVEDPLCAAVDCSSQNECIGDGTCNLEDGLCIAGDNKPVDTVCTEDGGNFCDGAGACVECNENAQCTDNDPSNPCTRVDCQSNQCQQVFTGESCVFPPDLPGICKDGDCVDAGLCDPLPDCEDRGDCVEIGCNPADGECTYENKGDGTSCTPDGAPDGTCKAGVCEAGPPQVVSFLPAGDAVERNAKITATFDRAMDPSTISAATFKLESGSSTVSGSVTYNPTTMVATLTPTRPLTLTLNHTATLTTGIENASGRALASTETVEFKVRDGDWGDPVRIDGLSVAVENPRVAVSENGDALVVWKQGDLRWVRLTPNGGKSSAAVLDTGDDVSVGMDAAGNAMAVFGRGSGIAAARRLVSGSSTWGAPTEQSDSFCNVPMIGGEIAVTSSGKALAVWSCGRPDRLFGADFDGNVWGSLQTLESGSNGDGNNLYDVEVAIAPDGTGAAIWQRKNSTVHSIELRRFTGSSWAPTERLDTTGDASTPHIAVDDQHNAMAVWNYDGTEVHYQRYRADLDLWLNPGRVDTSNLSSFNPAVAADGAGNFHFIWSENINKIRARRWRSASEDFAAVDTLPTTPMERVRLPQIAIEPRGTGLAVWHQEDGTIRGGRFRFGSDWQDSGDEVIHSVAAGAVVSEHRPRIAIRPDGTAVAVWGTGNDVFVARFE